MASLLLVTLAARLWSASSQCGHDGRSAYPRGSTTCATVPAPQGKPAPAPQGDAAPAPGSDAPTSMSAHAAPMLGDVARTTVSGTDARSGKLFPAGENIFGPFEVGFSAPHSDILKGYGCNPGSLGYVDGGIDTDMVEQMVAHQCGITLPRIEGANYISFLDECGGHTNEYHFHKGMSCLYDGTSGFHSPQIGQALDGKRLYGKWENAQTRGRQMGDGTWEMGELPLLDACGGHFGLTSSDPRQTEPVYHYHVQDRPPFTVGCFGPNVDNTLVTVQQCRSFYSGCDGELVSVTTPQGTHSYDKWCPCFDENGLNTGSNIAQLAVFARSSQAPETVAQVPVVDSPALAPEGASYSPGYDSGPSSSASDASAGASPAPSAETGTGGSANATSASPGPAPLPSWAQVWLTPSQFAQTANLNHEPLSGPPRKCEIVGAGGCTEPGWHCPRGETCRSVCGDGLLRGWEVCDDGNLENGDGCDDSCHIEPGWLCEQPGKKCEAVCGDSLIALPVEQCDDGNARNFDGCSAHCQWELGRCALQASSLCAASGAVGALGATAFEIRDDVPPERWCSRRQCTVEECCRPLPGTCLPGAALTGALDCATRARGLDDQPQKRKICKGAILEEGCVLGCASYTCPLHWTHRKSFEEIACPQGSTCSHQLCCETSGTSCTCRDAECCAETLSPPPFIRIDNSSALFFDLAGPTAIMTTAGYVQGEGGKLRWYYALRGGSITHVDLRSILNGSEIVLQGYKLSLPTLPQLEILLGSHNPSPIAFGEHLENINFHVWSSTQNGTDSYWVHKTTTFVLGAIRNQPRYVALETERKQVMLEVSEAFTVVLGSTKLTRMRLHEGMHCCFEEDDKTLEGLPDELVGATFFELSGQHTDHKAGIFSVISQVDAIVYGVAVSDSRRLNGNVFVSGYPAEEGGYHAAEERGRLSGETPVFISGYMAEDPWEEVPAEGFQLMPWRFPMGSWKRHLKAGVQLEIPHLHGLYGSIALKPA